MGLTMAHILYQPTSNLTFGWWCSFAQSSSPRASCWACEASGVKVAWRCPAVVTVRARSFET